MSSTEVVSMIAFLQARIARLMTRLVKRCQPALANPSDNVLNIEGVKGLMNELCLIYLKINSDPERKIGWSNPVDTFVIFANIKDFNENDVKERFDETIDSDKILGFVAKSALHNELLLIFNNILIHRLLPPKLEYEDTYGDEDIKKRNENKISIVRKMNAHVYINIFRNSMNLIKKNLDDFDISKGNGRLFKLIDKWLNYNINVEKCLKFSATKLDEVICESLIHILPKSNEQIDKYKTADVIIPLLLKGFNSFQTGEIFSKWETKAMLFFYLSNQWAKDYLIFLLRNKKRHELKKLSLYVECFSFDLYKDRPHKASVVETSSVINVIKKFLDDYLPWLYLSYGDTSLKVTTYNKGHDYFSHHNRYCYSSLDLYSKDFSHTEFHYSRAIRKMFGFLLKTVAKIVGYPETMENIAGMVIKFHDFKDIISKEDHYNYFHYECILFCLSELCIPDIKVLDLKTKELIFKQVVLFFETDIKYYHEISSYIINAILMFTETSTSLMCNLEMSNLQAATCMKIILKQEESLIDCCTDGPSDYEHIQFDIMNKTLISLSKSCGKSLPDFLPYFFEAFNQKLSNDCMKGSINQEHDHNVLIMLIGISSRDGVDVFCTNIKKYLDILFNQIKKCISNSTSSLNTKIVLPNLFWKLSHFVIYLPRFGLGGGMCSYYKFAAVGDYDIMQTVFVEDPYHFRKQLLQINLDVLEIPEFFNDAMIVKSIFSVWRSSYYYEDGYYEEVGGVRYEGNRLFGEENDFKMIDLCVRVLNESNYQERIDTVTSSLAYIDDISFTDFESIIQNIYMRYYLNENASIALEKLCSLCLSNPSLTPASSQWKDLIFPELFRQFLAGEGVVRFWEDVFENTNYSDEVELVLKELVVPVGKKFVKKSFDEIMQCLQDSRSYMGIIFFLNKKYPTQMIEWFSDITSGICNDVDANMNLWEQFIRSKNNFSVEVPFEEWIKEVQKLNESKVSKEL